MSDVQVLGMNNVLGTAGGWPLLLALTIIPAIFQVIMPCNHVCEISKDLHSLIFTRIKINGKKTQNNKRKKPIFPQNIDENDDIPICRC